MNIDEQTEYDESAGDPSVYTSRLFMGLGGSVKNLNIMGRLMGAEASGLAWFNVGTIENVSFHGTIEAVQYRAGGLLPGTPDMDIGDSYGHISNCTMGGKISSPYSAGGIVASVYRGFSIEGCTVEAGTEIAGGIYSGGIAGTIEREMQGRHIRNCTSNATRKNFSAQETSASSASGNSSRRNLPRSNFSVSLLTPSTCPTLRAIR